MKLERKHNVQHRPSENSIMTKEIEFSVFGGTEEAFFGTKRMQLNGYCVSKKSKPHDQPPCSFIHLLLSPSILKSEIVKAVFCLNYSMFICIQ